MGVLTAVTTNEANFSFRLVESGDQLEIPGGQQMVLCGQFCIEENAQLFMEVEGEIALI